MASAMWSHDNEVQGESAIVTMDFDDYLDVVATYHFRGVLSTKRRYPHLPRYCTTNSRQYVMPFDQK